MKMSLYLLKGVITLKNPSRGVNAPMLSVVLINMVRCDCIQPRIAL